MKEMAPRLALILMLTAHVSLNAQAAVLVNEAGEAQQEVDARSYFAPAAQFAAGRVDTDPAKLAQVARETLAYLNKYPNDRAVQANLLSELKVTPAALRRTLEKIVQTEAEDRAAKRPSRLLDPKWLEQEFELVRWSADTAGARNNRVTLPDRRLRITKYVVFEGKGSPVQTATHTCALYAVPDEEINQTLEQADARKAQLLRYRYTKQQIVAGALKGKGVKPLVWLTRQGLEDALMQGSIMVTMPDGKKRMFNVHRNNGIAYDRRIKDPKDQARYWYFKEVAGILGYGQDEKIIVQPGVTFAGDVYNLGLGKLIAIRYMLQGKPVLRLGVLADTGGAFVPNLYQLDYLAGVFPDRAAYQRGVAALPEYAETFLLIAR
ncbi:MAG: hypothetical protein ACO1RX_14230 [Candidatus Sericytochromatia bacterium]